MSEEINQEESKQGIKNTVYVSKEQAEKIREVIANKSEDSQKLNDLEAENRQLKAELEAFEKQGGQGTLPASLNGNFGNEGGSGAKAGNQREFEGSTLREAYRNMIDTLRKEGDTETLNKLLAKGIGAFKTNFEFKDPWKDGKSCVAHVLDAQNKRARRE